MEQFNDYILELKGLTKYYGQHLGIKDLDLQVKSGIIYGFLGPNGAGKTTTIRCILGILIPTRGKISVFNQTIKSWNDHIALKEKIGYLPGEFDLYRHYTVRQVLNYFSSLRKRPSVLQKQLIRYFEVDTSRKVTQLSKGNKQKIGLVQALMHDPELIILDEPSAGLDPLMQQKLYSLLKEFKDQGKTIFCSSHNLSEVQKICDEVAIIREGFLVNHEQIDNLSQQVHQKIILTIEESIDDILRRIPLVSHFEKTSMNGNYRYSLYLKTINPNYNEIFPYLKQYTIRNVTIPEPSLEDYFLKYYKA